MMFHVFKTYQIYVFSIFFNLLFFLLLNTKSFLILKSISFQAYPKPFYYHWRNGISYLIIEFFGKWQNMNYYVLSYRIIK